MVTIPNAVALPYSYSMAKDGSLRLPEVYWKGVPAIIDDAYMGKITPVFMDALKEVCKKGCILDFERPVNSFHMALLSELEKWSLATYWLPERYASYSKKATIIVRSLLPHNSWKMFCESQRRKFSNRWALELQPIDCTRKLPHVQTERTYYLEDAVCNCKIQGKEIHYFDTKESLLRKLHIAGGYGCQGAIALWAEWPKK